MIDTVIDKVLVEIVGAAHVDMGDAVSEDVGHDEALGASPVRPLAVVRPGSTEEVAAIVRAAASEQVPLTPRGSGTGLSGGCIPVEGGVVVSFERMRSILEIDTANHVAVAQPGVTLAELDDALAPHGLIYPVFPGEQSASLGGNVATNAGGMRAVKYGVTRHHVLGTEATLRLHPRPEHQATLLAPFATLEQIAAVIPPIVASGVGPLLVEYIDLVSMAGITANAGIDLGIDEGIKERALAYLVIVLEDHHLDRLDEDVQSVAAELSELGALDVFVLPDRAGAQLVDARERAFWAAKANGADDIVDVVVPRASIPEYLQAVGALAAATASLVVGCGHAGDGNVHLSVWQGDPGVRHRLLHDIIEAGLSLGGAVSGSTGSAP